MATKATTKKEINPEEKVKTAKKPTVRKKKVVSATPAFIKAEKASVPEQYVYAVGRRKTAVAQVRLYPSTEAEGAIVNKKSIREYFGTVAFETMALSPMKTTGLETSFRVSVVVRGGGLHGQADAIKLGVARCLIKHDILLRPVLKAQIPHS